MLPHPDAFKHRAAAVAAIDECLRAAHNEHQGDVARLRSEGKRLHERLAESLRRLRQFESESQWSAAVADAARLAANRVLVFSVNTGKLCFQAARGIEVAELRGIALSEAAAFSTAVESAEPAVALKSKRELSEALASIVGEDPNARFAVYPITTRQRVAAVVYAEDADPALLDLVVTAAGAALESHLATAATRGAPAGMIAITPAGNAPFITRDEEERHSRARRFARVQVAEIRLYHSQGVKAGRADKNIYGALKPQLDEVRRVYQEQYLKEAPPMADYLHQEIMRTLANGNADLLGPEYPGTLV